MNFCSHCGQPVELRIPPDDNRERHVCGDCGTIHYQNPKMVVGSVPLWHEAGIDKVLLCRRAIEPRRGYWTLPAGFMENNETTAEAAARETLEEAGARVEMLDLDYSAGTESLEVKLFSEAEIPWEEIAFPTVAHTLKFFFADLADHHQGRAFSLRSMDIRRKMSD